MATQNPKARENGKGSVYPENVHGELTGKWIAALTVDLIDGKPRRLRKFYASRDAAIEGLGDMRGLRDQGVVSSSATVKVYLTNYLSQHLPRRSRGGRQIRASTVDNYCHVAKRIYKCIGTRRLDRLTATIIEDDLLQPMADEGLSEATIRRTLHVLRMCMTHAVRRGDLQRTGQKSPRSPTTSPLQRNVSL